MSPRGAAQFARLALASALALALASGCVPPYRPPSAAEPHATIKVRRSYETRAGVTLREVSRVNGRTSEELESDVQLLLGPRASGFLVHPPASVSVAASFFHVEQRLVRESYTEQESYMDSESYSCGSGTSYRTCTRSVTRVTKYRRSRGPCSVRTAPARSTCSCRRRSGTCTSSTSRTGRTTPAARRARSRWPLCRMARFSSRLARRSRRRSCGRFATIRTERSRSPRDGPPRPLHAPEPARRIDEPEVQEPQRPRERDRERYEAERHLPPPVACEDPTHRFVLGGSVRRAHARRGLSVGVHGASTNRGALAWISCRDRSCSARSCSLARRRTSSSRSRKAAAC